MQVDLPRWFAPLCVLAILPAVAQAQDRPSSAVVSAGASTIKQQPTLLRMRIQLSGEAPTLKEALEKLKDRREAALLQLKAMDAKEDSIVFTDPSLSSGMSERQQQMQQMMRMRGGRRAKAIKMPTKVTVTTTLTAEWPLDQQGAEELLLAYKQLQDKVVEADLAGLKEPKQLTPEEEELAEEMAEMFSDYGYNEEASAGEPQFAFVARISDQQRREALAGAFQKARQNAEQLAAAAGGTLGDVVQINGHSSINRNDLYRTMMGSYGRREYWSQMMIPGAYQDDEDETPQEGVSPEPGPISVNVVVQATFELKK